MSETMRKKAGPGTKHPWLMFGLAYVAAFSAPLNMMKVPAVAPALIGALGIDPSGIGFLMSAYTLTGVVFALPASGIARKFGYKNAGLFALIVSLAGAVIGCFAADLTMLLVSRIFEGVGLCMLNIILISTAFAWFTPEKRGLAIGFGSTNVALAACLGQPVLAALGDAFGYSMSWYFSAGFTLVATLLFLLYKNPEFTAVEQETRKINMFKAIGQNKKILLLLVLFTLHNFCIVGVLNNFASTYLTEVYGITMTVASLFSALAALCVVIFAPIVGKLADKFQARKIFLVVGSICGLVLAAIYFTAPNLVVVGALCVLVGIESACIVCISQTAGPEILGSTELAPVSSSLLTFGQNLGQFVGPTMFGLIVISLGWATTSWILMIPLFVINLVVAIFIKLK